MPTYIEIQIILARCLSFLLVILGSVAYGVTNPPNCRASEDLGPYGVIQDKMGRLFLPHGDFTQTIPVEGFLPKFLAIRNILAKQGTQLIIVPIPARGMIIGDQLDYSNRYVSSYNQLDAQKNYINFISAFNRMGIVTVDVLTPSLKMKAQFSLPYDVHFTPAGSKTTAEAVAEKIKKLPIYKFLLKKQFVTSLVGIINAPSGYIEILNRACATDVQVSQPVSVYRTGEGGNDLLGDSVPEVVLWGTSFSANPAWNFAGFLKESLRTDMVNFSTTGGGVLSSAQSYFLKSNVTRPKLIIWEFGVDWLGENAENDSQWLQLLNSAKGCYGTQSLTAVSINGIATFTLPIFLEPARATIKFEELSIVDFQIVHKMNSEEAVQRIYRGPFIKNTGLFFVDIDQSSVSSTILVKTKNEKFGGTVVLTICR